MTVYNTHRRSKHFLGWWEACCDVCGERFDDDTPELHVGQTGKAALRPKLKLLGWVRRRVPEPLTTLRANAVGDVCERCAIPGDGYRGCHI